MKKLIILSISLCLLLGLNVKGQFLKNIFKSHYVKGIVVLKNGDTLRGNINFSNSSSDYQYLIMRDSLNNEKLPYRPKDLRYFQIDSMFFYPKMLKRDDVFMQLIVNDSLKLYKYRY